MIMEQDRLARDVIPACDRLRARGYRDTARRVWDDESAALRGQIREAIIGHAGPASVAVGADRESGTFVVAIQYLAMPEPALYGTDASECECLGLTVWLSVDDPRMNRKAEDTGHRAYIAARRKETEHGLVLLSDPTDPFSPEYRAGRE